VKSAADNLHLWDCAVAFHRADGEDYEKPSPYNLFNLIGGEYTAPAGGATRYDKACVKYHQLCATVDRRREEEALLRNEATRYFAYYRHRLQLLNNDIAALRTMIEAEEAAAAAAAAAAATDAAPETRDVEPDAEMEAAPPPLPAAPQPAPPAEPVVPAVQPAVQPTPAEAEPSVAVTEQPALSPVDALPASVRSLLFPAPPAPVAATPGQEAPAPVVSPSISPAAARLGCAVARAKVLALERSVLTCRSFLARAREVWVDKGLPIAGRRKVAVPPIGDVLPRGWDLPHEPTPEDLATLETQADELVADADAEAEADADPAAGEEVSPEELQRARFEAEQRLYFQDAPPAAAAAQPLYYGDSLL